ncbi:hypothetical protein [Gordonia hydrophobica]|uniref:SHOCT domain-containing protein n=1 Tax=Gordonia hydrophobica TaxID=40516 RepID=A0ABZ2U3F5_9ACTN|nr:hypothetical protein [Gordonia hydrophobica]MBM7367533.1 hypothetical protein [Gordonia hydrophobica]
MTGYQPSQEAWRQLDVRGGPRSALRLVGPGEDPRVVSTDPDHFFRRPHDTVMRAALVALIVGTAVLGYATVAWFPPPGAPTALPVAYAVTAGVLIAPVWVWWFWQRRRDAAVTAARAVCASADPGVEVQRSRSAYVRFAEHPRGLHRLEVDVVADLGSSEAVFAGARYDRSHRSEMLFGFRDPIWVWRSGDWMFGQVAPHGVDPTYDPVADEPRIPTFEELHGGRSPASIRAELMDLAARFRAGTVTRAEYDAAVRKFTSP